MEQMNTMVPNQIVFTILLLTLLLSCDEKRNEFIRKENSLIKKEYYKNGQINKITKYSLDTMKNGSTMEFYQTGQIKRQSFYVNGELNSEDSLFHKSGLLSIYQYWTNGKLIGNAYHYYDAARPMVVGQNGDTSIMLIPKIKKFISYNQPGVSAFETDYNIDETVISYEGHGILSVYESNDTNNNDLSLKLRVAYPPLSDRKLLISLNYKNITTSPYVEYDISKFESLVDYLFIPEKVADSYAFCFIYNINAWKGSEQTSDTVQVFYRPGADKNNRLRMIYR
jgi:hypothetical protein